MPDAARETIFRTLERALGRTRGPASPVASPALALPEPLTDPESFAAAVKTLTEETASLGVGLRLAANPDELKTALAEILEQRNAASAAVWDTDLLRTLGVRDLLLAQGVALPEINGNCRSLAEVDLGVTTADALLVETATLVLRADPAPEETRGRGYSLLPPVHLAIVPAAALVPDVGSLPALYQNWTKLNPPRAVHFVTGASSTADIEKILVKGVHGPMGVEIILLTPEFGGPEG